MIRALESIVSLFYARPAMCKEELRQYQNQEYVHHAQNSFVVIESASIEKSIVNVCNVCVYHCMCVTTK